MKGRVELKPKHVMLLIATAILLMSCSNDVAKDLLIGHCVFKESDAFKLFSQGNDDVLLSYNNAEIMIYIKKNSSADLLDRSWKTYTIIDKNYKIEQFGVGRKILNGIVTKSVNKRLARIWVYIPIYPDTSIRIDYPDNANEQAKRQIVVRQFLKSISIKP